MLDKILALLARLPADSAAIDWTALALAALGGVALLLGLVTPDQLPGLVDAALGLLVAAGLRGASLAAKGSTVAGAKSLAKAVTTVRAGGRAPDELLALAAALVVAARRGPPAALAPAPALAAAPTDEDEDGGAR